MITILSEDEGLALVYTEDRPDEALLMIYTNHGDGVIETWPPERTHELALHFPRQVSDTADIVDMLHELLPVAVTLYERHFKGGGMADLQRVVSGQIDITPESIINGGRA